MATRRKEDEPDVVQAEGPGPSVLIPYPGSALPSSPIAVTPVAARPAVAEEDESEEEEAEESEEVDDESEEEDDAPRPSAAFMKPFTPSPQLALVVGTAPLTRVEVTRRVWEYISKHKLQDAANKRMINLDATLKGIFGDQAQINMFEMTVALTRHLS